MNLHEEMNGGSTMSFLPQRRTATSSQFYWFEAYALRLIQCWALRLASSELSTIRSVISLRINRHTGMREVMSPQTGNHPRTATRRIDSVQPKALHKGERRAQS